MEKYDLDIDFGVVVGETNTADLLGFLHEQPNSVYTEWRKHLV